MPWYRTGTVAVTNGSKNVTGVGTLFSTAVSPGDAFALVDANGNPTGAWYEIETVTSNTALVLKQTYAGTTGSNKQFAVFNLTGNMTVPSFAQRLAQFFNQFQSSLDQPNTTPTANSIPVADSAGKINTGWLKDATTAEKGVVELATTAEAQAGTDATRAVTPAGALAAMQKYGVGALQIDGLTVDYDTLKRSGQYVQGPTAPNAPPISSYCFVLVITHLPTYVVQQAISIDGTRGFQRCCHNGTWGDWYDIPISSAPRANTLSVTSTDDATSATAAPLKSAGGLAVAKDVWVGGAVIANVLRLGSSHIRAKSFNGFEGVDILESVYGDVSTIGLLFANERGTENYLVASFIKKDASTQHVATVLASNVLTLGAKNVAGTQVITNATVPANVFINSIIIKGGI